MPLVAMQDGAGESRDRHVHLRVARRRCQILTIPRRNLRAKAGPFCVRFPGTRYCACGGYNTGQVPSRGDAAYDAAEAGIEISSIGGLSRGRVSGFRGRKGVGACRNLREACRRDSGRNPKSRLRAAWVARELLFNGEAAVGCDAAVLGVLEA